MRRTFRTSDGHELSYIAQGEGSWLLLLHGWSQSAAMFRHQVSAFSKTHRVLALDFRGHGESDRRPGGYRIARFAKDVAELLDHEGCGTVSVLGWSMGASVLWSYIDLFGTERLRSVILVDEPAAVMRQPGMDDEAFADSGAILDAASLADTASAIVGPDGAATRDAFLGVMVTKAIDPALRAWLLTENLRVEAGVAASLLIDHASLDWRDIFARIDVPAIVFGGHASHVSVRSQRWIASRIPGAEIVVTDADKGGAHFMFIEDPEPFNAAVARFLTKVDRRA